MARDRADQAGLPPHSREISPERERRDDRERHERGRHDGKHKAADGKTTIQGNDCNSCHLILAQGSDEDMNKLNAKGSPFIHVDSEYSDFSCAECHTGAAPKE